MIAKLVTVRSQCEMPERKYVAKCIVFFSLQLAIQISVPQYYEKRLFQTSTCDGIV